MTHDLNKLLKVLAKMGPPEQLHIVYEAGPTGYGLQRALHARGYVCEVIAPSQIPRRPGDRVKTDARDCMQLAECSRAGQLRAVWIPDLEDEAIRDLARAREDAVNSRTQVRQQLKGFLLRHDVRYSGKTSWSSAYYRWLATLNFERRRHRRRSPSTGRRSRRPTSASQRLTKALQSSITGWRFEPVVGALQALRGIDAISAIGLVAEIGDLARFEHPRKLMGYLGLVPSEHSSGERTSRGSITKTGNAHARRLLTEAAWNYRFKARIGREAQRRQEALSESIRTIGLEGAVEADAAICRTARRVACRSTRPAWPSHESWPASSGRLRPAGPTSRQAQASKIVINRDRSGDATRAPIGQPSRLLQGAARKIPDSRARQARDESMKCW